MLFYLNKRQNTISVFHTIFQVPFIKSSRTEPKNSQTVRFVLTESTFKVGSIAIKNLAFSFLDTIMKSAYETIAIAMNHFSLTIQKPSLPVTDNFDFSCGQGVGAFAMPQIKLPLSLIELSCRLVVISSVAVSLVVFKCAHINIAVEVGKLSLEWSVVVEIGSFETLSAWQYEGRIRLQDRMHFQTQLFQSTHLQQTWILLTIFRQYNSSFETSKYKSFFSVFTHLSTLYFCLLFCQSKFSLNFVQQSLISSC